MSSQRTNRLEKPSSIYDGTIHGRLYLPHGWTRITRAHSPKIVGLTQKKNTIDHMRIPIVKIYSKLFKWLSTTLNKSKYNLFLQIISTHFCNQQSSSISHSCRLIKVSHWHANFQFYHMIWKSMQLCLRIQECECNHVHRHLSSFNT